MYPFTNFKSYNYWTQNNERIAQSFYVTVCLYISAASDYSVGLDLGKDGKLNWSATSSYYSMVHSARMVTFLAVGDFPMRHDHISELFSGGFDGLQPNQEMHEYSCSWLKGFLRKTGVGVGQINGQDAKISLNNLSLYYDRALAADVDELFRVVGKVLCNARDLRNDSNYEALLMAHETRHPKVTADFKVLSAQMLVAAEVWFRLATKCLRLYIERDQHLHQYRNAYSHFLNDCISERIHSPILDRINNTQSVLRKIDELTAPLRERLSGHAQPQGLAEEIALLENWISMNRFNPKLDLMRGFGRKISELRRDVELATQTLAATTASQ